MNILVFSDSHGHGDLIEEVVHRQITPPDAVFFLGDGLRDLAWCDLCGSRLYSIRGNCDFYSSDDTGDEIFTELGGIKIFAAHGHKYSVKSGYLAMAARAASLGADIMLFGHTHEPICHAFNEGDTVLDIKLTKKLYVMNPGSIGQGKSFGTVTVRNGVILMHLANM